MQLISLQCRDVSCAASPAVTGSVRLTGWLALTVCDAGGGSFSADAGHLVEPAVVFDRAVGVGLAARCEHDHAAVRRLLEEHAAGSQRTGRTALRQLCCDSLCLARCDRA